MRIFLKYLVLCLFIFGGCRDHKEEDPFIELNADVLAFTSEGGSQTISVSSNGDWSVSGESEWCSLSPKTGSGNATVTVTVTENLSSTEQKAVLTFTCGAATATIDIMQAAEDELNIQTHYVEIDWGKSTITAYNEETGVITIRFQGDPPVLEINKAIILPEEYRHDIRVITGATVNGNTVTLQTEQGNLAHLFMDISFTLSTDPSLSASSLKKVGGGKIVTPSEISIATDEGYKIIYHKNNLKAGTEYTDTYDIFSMHEDYSGTDLFNQNGHRATWEKCKFDIGLKGVFIFDFGKTVVDNIPYGDIQKFEFYLDGNLNIDLLLKYAITAGFKQSKESLIKEKLFPAPLKFKFLVGNVPVNIFVETDLYSRYDLEATSEITMSAGCNLQANAQLGLNWTKGPGISPIISSNNSFTPYDPIFTAKGSLMVKASVYPRINFEIYKCICPWVEAMPYLKDEFEGGMRTGTDGNNYLGWTLKDYAGLDCRMGLKMDFGRLLPYVNIGNTDIYNLADVILCEAPAKVELYSPTNDTKIIVGTPVNVSFLVSRLNNITEHYFPRKGAFVIFTTEGNVDKSVTETDVNGLAAVQWSPKNKEDKLSAKIVDKSGKTISEATFTPKLEDNLPVINLVSPENGVKLTVGKPVDIQFYASIYNHSSGKYDPCPNVTVSFETQGVVNKKSALTGVNGEVMVQWTPENIEENLTAKIMDNGGKTISEATFTPKLEYPVIELVSPENGKTLTVGEPVDVRFYVSSYNYIIGKYEPYSSITVNFDTEGVVNNSSALSDGNGWVVAQWTPTKREDKLIAKIVDKNGKTISEAAFTPEYEFSGNKITMTVAENRLVSLKTVSQGSNTIDWGDGSEVEKFTTTSPNKSHIYTGTPPYTITISVSSNTSLLTLNCRSNQLTSLDVSGPFTPMIIDCSFNRLTSLTVSDVPKLSQLDCQFNYMTATALNNLFHMLPTAGYSDTKLLFIGWNGPNNDSTGTNGCDKSIAESKGWRVSNSSL